MARNPPPPIYDIDGEVDICGQAGVFMEYDTADDVICSENREQVEESVVG